MTMPRLQLVLREYDRLKAEHHLQTMDVVNKAFAGTDDSYGSKANRLLEQITGD